MGWTFWAWIEIHTPELRISKDLKSYLLPTLSSQSLRYPGCHGDGMGEQPIVLHFPGRLSRPSVTLLEHWAGSGMSGLGVF